MTMDAGAGLAGRRALLAHVAQPHRCYVGDEVTFSTRITLGDSAPIVADGAHLLLVTEVRFPQLQATQQSASAGMPLVVSLQSPGGVAATSYNVTRFEPVILSDGLAWVCAIKIASQGGGGKDAGSVEVEAIVRIKADLYKRLCQYLLEHGHSPELVLDRERDVHAQSVARLFSIESPVAVAGHPSQDAQNTLEALFEKCLLKWWRECWDGQPTQAVGTQAGLREAIWACMLESWRASQQPAPTPAPASQLAGALLAWVEQLTALPDSLIESSLAQAILPAYAAGMAAGKPTQSAFERALQTGFIAWLNRPESAGQPETARLHLLEGLWLAIVKCVLAYALGVLQDDLRKSLTPLNNEQAKALPRVLQEFRALLHQPDRCNHAAWAGALLEYLGQRFSSAEHPNHPNLESKLEALVLANHAPHDPTVSLVPWLKQLRTGQSAYSDVTWLTSLLDEQADRQVSAEVAKVQPRLADAVQTRILDWLAARVASAQLKTDSELASFLRDCLKHVDAGWPSSEKFPDAKTKSAEALTGVLLGAFMQALESQRAKLKQGQHPVPGIRLEAQDRTALAIGVMSRTMRYLPALYRQANNDLLGRFLLVNESLVAPMEQRLQHLEAYFDPMLAPVHLLPWLASWGGEQLDARLRELQQRTLLKHLLPLQRARGTPCGLKKHIALLIGQEPEIVEQRSGNLKLGSGARLGQSLALGTTNQAHMFTVYVPSTHFQDNQMRSVLESLIAWHQPAHTRSQLQPNLAPVTKSSAKAT